MLLLTEGCTTTPLLHLLLLLLTEFPWVLPRLTTPGSDPFPFLPCCLQGPLTDASAVRTDANVDLLASSARWVPHPPKEVLAATLLFGVNRYVEGIPYGDGFVPGTRL